MAANTKMVIITSNEDLMRHFSLHKVANTHIIDLDNAKREASTEADQNDTVNLASLAELSENNPSINHVHKRALDSSQRHSPLKILKKSSDFICVICGDRAIGYNYDVLSCGSCKTFFARNVNQPEEKIRCLTGQRRCSVASDIHHKCRKCRLERCFKAGMRKEFYFSNEKKQRRKRHAEKLQRITSQSLCASDSTDVSSTPPSAPKSTSHSTTIDDIDQLLMGIPDTDGDVLFAEDDRLNPVTDELTETVSVEGGVMIERLQLSLSSIFQNDFLQHPPVDNLDRTHALISWSHIVDRNVPRFISFCHQIAEFKALDTDDRFVLIKYNLLPLYPILKCIFHNSIYQAGSNGGNEELRKHEQLHNLCFGSGDLLDRLRDITLTLAEITEQDSAISCLLLIVLLFCQGLSIGEDQPVFKDSFTVHRAQFHFTNVLWNYMSNKWSATEACKRYCQLISIVFRIQSLAKSFHDYFHAKLMTPDIVDRMAPLMQSIMNIS